MKKSLIALGIVALIAVLSLAIEMLRDSRPKLFGGKWLAMIGACIVALVLILTLHFAHARDLGQWENTDSSIREWYQALMQPDVPTMSCCGEADAYWCDDYYGRDGKAYCRITDDRPDEPRGRPHREMGTEFDIPEAKLKWDRSNPTGHGIIFLSRGDFVYCYVAPGGV